SRQRIVERCGKAMLRRQPIADSQRADFGRTPGLGHHAPMAVNGAGAIATTMEEQEDAAGVASRRYRPLPGYAGDVDRGECYVRGDGPNGTNLVEAPTPFRPSNRPRLGSQQCTDGLYLVLILLIGALVSWMERSTDLGNRRRLRCRMSH